MLFNLYYLNFAKAYEIKMMLSNVVKTGETIETNQQDELNAELTRLLRSIIILEQKNYLKQCMKLFILKLMSLVTVI